jgi:hypothetical protein
MRLLAYGAHAEPIDDYLCMGKSRTIDVMYKLYRAVVTVFKPEGFRSIENKKISYGSEQESQDLI